jgi:sodium transport system ATP-binding protein
MIEVNNVSKSFVPFSFRKTKESINAVNGLDLTCQPGRVMTLLGPNGAGKTTLLRMIATLIRPQSGRISICGSDTQRQANEARRSIGFITGTMALYDRLTVRETLKYFGRLSGLSVKSVRVRTSELAAKLGFEDFMDRKIARLSTGMKQKVAIARSLIHNPEVLILDEPTSGLDIVAAVGTIDMIKAYRDAGKTILFSTHRMDEVSLLSDDLAIIHQGTLIYNGTFTKFKNEMTQPSLESEFIKRVEAG